MLLAEKQERLRRLLGGKRQAYFCNWIFGQQQRVMPGDHRVVEHNVHTAALFGFGDANSARIRCFDTGVRQVRSIVELLLNLV